MSPTQILSRSRLEQQLAMILGMATATPVGSIDQAESAILAQQLGITRRWRDALPALYRKSGVKRRASVLLDTGSNDHGSRQSFYPIATNEKPNGPTTAERMRVYAQYAGPLLQTACEEALKASVIEPDTLTHLITVSCTGFFSPGIDHQLIDSLGLGHDVQRVHVGFMGCHGLINALRVGSSIIRADSKASVLVGAVELCSIHQQYSEDPQQLVANSLFADGAGSVVLGVAPHEMDKHGDRTDYSWRIESSFSWKLQDTAEYMGWWIGDHGFQMKLSPEVPGIIASALREPIEHWLSEQQLTLEDVEAWGIHPGGPRILTATENALQLSSEKMEPSRAVLAENGNMSSPTILFILEKLATYSASSRNCVLIAFGPGLHVEAMLLMRS